MGDLNTHADVAHHVMPIVKEGIPKDAAGAPRVNVWLFELGNFLTDLSQLRDPPAHHSGKLKVWQGERLIQETPLYTAEAVPEGGFHQKAFDAVGELLLGWIP